MLLVISYVHHSRIPLGLDSLFNLLLDLFYVRCGENAFCFVVSSLKRNRCLLFISLFSVNVFHFICCLNIQGILPVM